MLLRQYMTALSNVIWPSACAQCAVPVQPEQIFCLFCEHALPRADGFLDSAFGSEIVLREMGVRVMYVSHSFYYVASSPLALLMGGLKYKNQRRNAQIFGSYISETLQNAAWWKDIDCVVPVPLHPKKQAQRGYNQVVELWKNTTLKTPFRPELVMRSKHAKTQTKKTKDQRLETMKSAFTWSTDFAREEKTHVLILDDVFTTGSTIAGILESAPKQHVYSVYTVCRAL